MKITIEVPDNKVSFIMELFASLKFVNLKTDISKPINNDFANQWKSFSKNLPKSEPEISINEINEEIKFVRKQRSKRNLHSNQ